MIVMHCSDMVLTGLFVRVEMQDGDLVNYAAGYLDRVRGDKVEEGEIDKDRNTDKGRWADVFHPCEGEIGNQVLVCGDSSDMLIGMLF